MFKLNNFPNFIKLSAWDMFITDLCIENNGEILKRVARLEQTKYIKI